jgi:hypothetical protein
VVGDSRASNFTPYGTGWSNYFNGSSYLQVPYSANNNLSTASNWTIELWINMPTIPGNMMSVLGSSLGGGNVNKWFLNINMNTGFTYSSNRIGLLTCLNGVNRWINAEYIWVAGIWYHIAVVYNSGSALLYVNGQNVGSQPYNFASVTNPIRVGADGEAYAYFSGYISNLRIVRDTSLYTSNFTPSTTPLAAITNTSLLTCQSNRFLDNSTNNFVLTVNGTPSVQSFNPFGITNTGTSGSMYFDGSGDYLTTSGAALNTGAGTADITFECWVYNNGFAGSQYGRGIFVLYPSASYSSRMMLRLDSGSNRINCYLFIEGGFPFGVSGTVSTGSATVNAWTHLALVRSSQTFKLYINGALDTTFAATAASLNGLDKIEIGRNQDGSVPDFNGYISDFRYVKGTAVYTSNFTPPTAPLTAIANTSLLTLQNKQPHNNHSFQDSSSHCHLITRYNNTTQGTFSPFSQTGWGNYFNGSSFVYISNSSVLDLPGDFTIEFWLHPLNLSATLQSICGKWGNNQYAWLVQATSTSLILNMASLTSQSIQNITNSWSPLNGSWYHIAFTRSGTNVKAFVNGSQIGTTQTSSATCSSTTNMAIGANPDGPQQYYNGYVSNFRLVKNQVVYTGNFTPATAPLTANTVGATGAGAAASITGTVSLLTCQSNRFVDNSSNNFTLTSSGTPSVQAFSPFAPTAAYSPAVHGGSGYFDGAGDYLTATSTSGQLGAGNFTIECWVYLLGRVTSFPCIFGNYSSFAAGSFGLFAGHNSGDVTKYQLAINGTFPAIQSTASIVYNSWTHLAVVRNASVITLYINGVANGTTSISATLNGTNGTAWIGTVGDSLASGYLQGYLCDLRIVPNSAIYTASFTPPTAPLTAITNTSLLLNFTNAGITDATAKNVLETVGNAQISTVQSKWGGGSMSFDGSGDYLKAPSNPAFFISTENYTFECWIYKQTSARAILLSIASAGLSVAINASSNIEVCRSLTAIDFTFTAGILNNEWTHIAVSRSGNLLRAFKNGVLLGTQTSSTSYGQGICYLGIDADQSASPYLGYISDLRITKGVARYTANFAPPSGSFRLK